MTPAEALLLARQKHRERDFCLAELTYQHILASDPNHVGALHGLGVLLQQTGRKEAAAEHFRRALHLDANSPEGHHRLANALFEMGQYSEAAAAYQAALQIAPENGRAWNNLGSAQAALRNLPEAEACFRRAVELNPDYFEALSNLANALTGPRSHDEVAHLCRRALALQPNDAQTSYLLAALTGENTPPTAPRSYVTRMYDAYANHFENHLVVDLRYRGPEQMRRAIDDFPGSKSLDVMDLGCGTGLCGLAFHDLARTLTGVDLSAQMLLKAQAHQTYNRLILGDLRDALNAAPASFDLILAADVFIYIGDLAPVFPAARAALRAGGRFVLAVEATNGDGFVLRPSRRFAHSAAYIRAQASAHGFVEVAMQEGVLRTEHEQDIGGAVYVLRAKS